MIVVRQAVSVRACQVGQAQASFDGTGEGPHRAGGAQSPHGHVVAEFFRDLR